MAGLKEPLTIQTVVAQNVWGDKMKALRQKISPGRKKKIASPKLKIFLKDWLDWAEGRDSKHTYSKSSGLCGAATEYGVGLRTELIDLFDLKLYPFGEQPYFIGAMQMRQYRDPNRLAWVRAALNDTLDEWRLQ